MATRKVPCNDSWFCCVCKSRGKGILRDPNSSNSTTCEHPPCGHTRCSTCHEVSGHGVDPGDYTLSPTGGVGIYAGGSPSLPPMYLGQDKTESAADDACLLPESPSTQSSQSSSSTEHQAALSSSYNTKSVTHTDATTASNAAMFANSRHLNSNYRDKKPIGSNLARFYPGVLTVLINNLAQDLKHVDLATSEDMLTAQLEGFSLRFGNEHVDKNHLIIMLIIYRNARYE